MEEEVLKLNNQICFPLYACSKEIIRRYKPSLEKIDLTYTQYLVMLVLWEQDEINIKTLGERLYLDSGTLTPVLKKLERKEYIKKEKYKSDERNCIIRITEKGKKVKEIAKTIPLEVGKCIDLNIEDAKNLHRILNDILKTFNKEKDTSSID